MKIITRVVFLIIVSLQISSCSNIGAFGRKIKFDERSASWLVKPGEQILGGSGILNYPEGNRYTCAGNEVHLIPNTRYAKEWVTLRYGHYSGGITSEESTLKLKKKFIKYRLVTECYSGRFLFKNVKHGEFYLVTELSGIEGDVDKKLSAASLVRIRYHPGKTQFSDLPRLSHAEKYLVKRFEAQQIENPKETPNIRELQVILSQFGLDPGVPDGTLHKKTQKAIKQFQSVNLLPISGFPDSQTLKTIKKIKEDRKGWTASSKNTVWMFIATGNRNAHGASAGRDRLEAFTKGWKQCVNGRDRDAGKFYHGPCKVLHMDEVGSRSCVAFVLRYFTWEKYFGKGSTREDAYNNAYRACGANTHCKSTDYIGPKMEYTYCGSDFK